MKYPTSLFLFVALLAGGCQSVTSQTPAVPLTAIAVNYQQPDKFTDASDSFGSGTSDSHLEILREHIREQAARLLAEGQKLTVTITDIDLAGDFLPGRAAMNDVRVVKDIYSPRVELSFRLEAADGTVLKEGERRLRNVNFMNELRLSMQNESLGYDKELLTRWLRDEFKR